MRKGENIFKRKDGRWEARYIKGYEPSGKIKYGFCYGKTYREAKEKVTGLKAALAEKPQVLPMCPRNRISFFCDAWLLTRRDKIRESTYIKYVNVIEKHIKPRLGGCYPLGITTAAVDEFSKELLFDAGLSPKSVYDILVVLRSIFKYIASQFPGAFKSVEINYPRERHKEMRVLSPDEQKRFVAYLLNNTDACKAGVLLMLCTGLRIGELCALKWSNIDVKEKIISVNATMQRLRSDGENSGGKTRIVTGEPKSDNSLRKIPLSDLIADLCLKFETKNRNAYVLTGTERCMEPRTLQYRIKKYTEECGLYGVHAHTLRHTFATRAVEAGFELKSLSEILGHANTGITLNRYVHSSMALKRLNMEKLAAAAI